MGVVPSNGGDGQKVSLERPFLGALFLVELVDLPFGDEEGRPAAHGQCELG